MAPLITSALLLPAILLMLGRFAFLRSPASEPSIDEILRKLDHAAERALEEATFRFAYGAAEKQALEELIRLTNEIEAFRAHTRARDGQLAGFARLEEQFHRARTEFSRLNAYRHARQSFHELARCMTELKVLHYYLPEQPNVDESAPKSQSRTRNPAPTPNP